MEMTLWQTTLAQSHPRQRYIRDSYRC